MTTAQTLFDALGLDALEPAEREQAILDLYDLIFQGTLIRLIERMDEDTRTAFDQLMDADAPEDEVLAFLESRVPGAQDAVTETIEELRTDILAVSGEAPE